MGAHSRWRLANYNSSGVLQWKKTLGGTRVDYGSGVASGVDGSVYVSGNTTRTSVGDHDLLLAKYNSSGVLQWKKTLGGTGTEYGQGIATGAGGTVYVTGYTNSVGAGDYDLQVVKYNASGALQWQKTLGGTGIDDRMGIVAGAHGSIYVAGAGASDLLVVRLPSTDEGTLSGLIYFPGCGTARGNSDKLDRNNARMAPSRCGLD